MTKPRDPSSDAAIAEFIARRGVTRCPAAAVDATTATISEADKLAIAKHDEERESLAPAYQSHISWNKLTPAQKTVRRKLIAATRKVLAKRRWEDPAYREQQLAKMAAGRAKAAAK